MGKNAGVIYRSFVEAVRLLDDATQLEAINAYLDYLLDGTEYDGENAIVKALMLISYPTIDNTQKRYEARCENGKKGGRPQTKKEPNQNLNETEIKPNDNLTETEAEPNTNLKEEVEEEVEEEDKEEVEDKEEDKEEEDIQSLPAQVRPVPLPVSQEIKERVVADAEVSELAESIWISPASIKQDAEHIYISMAQKKAVEHIKREYGEHFIRAVYELNPDFKGSVAFAVG